MVSATSSMVDADGGAIPVLKRGQAMRLYRAAKLVMLDKGLGGVAPTPKAEAAPTPAPAPVADPALTRKAAEVIDQADDSTFALLPKSELLVSRHSWWPVFVRR